MTKIVATVVTVLALVFAGVASGARPMVVDEGGGGSSTVQRYTLVSITYRSDGFPIFWYCDYVDFGNGWVEQVGCHS